MSTTSTNTSHNQFPLSQSRLPVQVSIAGKCEASRASIEDRFKRCYSRLRAVVGGGGVCIGGGLPELLAAMEMKSIMNYYQSKSVHTDSDLALMPLLQQITDALLLYPVLVNTANGMTWTQANLHNNSVMQIVSNFINKVHENECLQCRSILECLERWPADDNTTTNKNLDVNIVHSFPVPICIPSVDGTYIDNNITEDSSHCHRCYDCILVKVESFRSAISFVANVLL